MCEVVHSMREVQGVFDDLFGVFMGVNERAVNLIRERFNFDKEHVSSEILN